MVLCKHKICRWHIVNARHRKKTVGTSRQISKGKQEKNSKIQNSQQ